MTTSASSRLFLFAFLALGSACSKEDKANLIAKVVDAAADNAAPAGPKNLDLAKAALVAAKAKYDRKDVVDADCPPMRSLAADFADSKDPDAIKTTRDIDSFCSIDVTLEGAVATLKTDNAKLVDAMKKKDKTTEQMYAATVRDNCATIRGQIDDLAAKHLDTELKVVAMKHEIEPICAPPAAKKK